MANRRISSTNRVNRENRPLGFRIQNLSESFAMMKKVDENIFLLFWVMGIELSFIQVGSLNIYSISREVVLLLPGQGGG